MLSRCAGFAEGPDEIHGRAGDASSGEQHDDLRHAFECLRRDLDVDPALEAVARVGREAERPAGCANASGIEVRHLEEDVRRRVGHLAVAPAHHAGDRLRDARRRR